MNEIEHGDEDAHREHEAKWAWFLQTANLGRLVVTPAAAELLEEAAIEAKVLLWRHATGDWGQVDREDREANDRAVISGLERTYSNYALIQDKCVWVVTEAERSATLLCLPEEYLQYRSLMPEDLNGNGMRPRTMPHTRTNASARPCISSR